VYALATGLGRDFLGAMPSKTISLELSSYERLVATRRPGESFSSTIDRITLPVAKHTARDLLAIKDWGKGVDWKRVEHAVSRRRRSRDLRPSA
jgi:predicted CopG family antitoxin